MYALVIALHILVCLILIGIILVQGGRGGMAETLGGSAAQSLFGGGANIVMTKITAICAALFMVTCLSLALLSTQRGRAASVIDRRLPASLPAALPTLPTDALPERATPTPPPAAPSAVQTPASSTATSTPSDTNVPPQ